MRTTPQLHYHGCASILALQLASPWLCAAAGPCVDRDSRDIVLAAAVGMAWPSIRPFVMSFRHYVGLQADLVLMVSAQLPATTAEELEKHKVIVVPVLKKWPYLTVPRTALDLGRLRALFPRNVTGLVPEGGRNGGMFTLRYVLAEAWLESQRFCADERVARNSIVLLSDTRDVIFQANPFDAAAKLRGSDEAWLFEEHPSRMIADDSWNLGQTYHTFGDEFGLDATNMTFVNGGVVLGTRSGIVRLVAAMRRVLQAYADTELNDQGILNLLARSSRAHQRYAPELALRVLPHANAIVRNVGSEIYDPAEQMQVGIDTVKLALDEANWLLILGADGAPAPVVHQYDRHDILARTVLERWNGLESPPQWRDKLAPYKPRSLADLDTWRDSVLTSHMRDELGGGCKEFCTRRNRVFGDLTNLVMAFPTRRLAELTRMCNKIGDAVPAHFSVDWSSLLRRLSKRPHAERSPAATMGRRKLVALAKLLIAPYGFLDEAIVGRVLPGGLRWQELSWLVCLDATCEEAGQEELVAAAWKLALRDLLDKIPEYAHKEMAAMGVETVEGLPQPEEYWIREIFWVNPISSHSGFWTNSSATLRGMRWKAFAGVD